MTGNLGKIKIKKSKAFVETQILNMLTSHEKIRNVTIFFIFYNMFL